MHDEGGLWNDVIKILLFFQFRLKLETTNFLLTLTFIVIRQCWGKKVIEVERTFKFYVY